ncbi:MAG: carboxymuconolactone decarboxylase family protein [Chloroflexota bacterium]
MWRLTIVFMPFIKIVSLEEARGFLKKEYENALERAGRIWNIVSIMSPNPRAMKASMDFYSSIMFGSSPLSRSQREMLATVVSATNHCVY